MFANTLLSNPSRDVRIDIDTPAARISQYSRIYVNKNRKTLSREATKDGQGQCKWNTIFLCQQCQHQTYGIVKPQCNQRSRIMRKNAS